MELVQIHLLEKLNKVAGISISLSFSFLVDKFTPLDPDPDLGVKMNADPCRSGSTALAYTNNHTIDC